MSYLLAKQINDRDIIDQVEDNVYRVNAGTESLDFEAIFHRVYQVLEGDGEEEAEDEGKEDDGEEGGNKEEDEAEDEEENGTVARG